MAEVLPFRFIAESGSLEGAELELGDSDLPSPPWPSGGELRETVTRYAGGDTSVQVHGVKLEPVELEGWLDDQWYGIPGHALNMREQMDAMMHSAGIVRFEYGEHRSWGTFSVRFDEERRDRIQYRIRFKPYWPSPPSTEATMEFRAPPNDAAVMVEEEIERVRSAVVDELPPIQNKAGRPIEEDGFMQGLIEGVLSAVSLHGVVMSKLAGVVDYAEMANDLVELVASSLRGTSTGLRNMSENLKTTSASTMASAGVDELLIAEYLAEVERRVRLARASTVNLLREFIREAKPVATLEHIVGAGETLPTIAADYYGDFSLWTIIADANDLDASSVAIGTLLKIPRL